MDEKIIKIVAARLRRMEGQPINQEKLESIRESVYSATRTNKSASFSNVKKWIKEARSMVKKQEKAAKAPAKAAQKAKSVKGKKVAKHPRHQLAPAERAEHHYREPVIPEVSKRVEESVNLIKDDVQLPVPLQEVNLSRPTIVFDKIYLQSIKFEIAGIRQTMERVSRQLDKLEKELVSHKAED